MSKRVCSFVDGTGDYPCDDPITEREHLCDNHKLITVEKFLCQINTSKSVAVYMLDGKTIGTLGEGVRQVLREIAR